VTPEARRRRFWIVAGVLGLFFAALVFVRLGGTGYQLYRVPSTSMAPTLQPSAFVIVNERDAALANLHRGDIVVFEPARRPGEQWVKRIVGMPGETVVAHGHDIEIDGKPLVEAWDTIREPKFQEGLGPTVARVTLGADEFYVLGDNRPNSEDSRFFGPIKRAALRGKLVNN
jgi:signal peptidase I